jgi:hypothetical protein
MTAPTPPSLESSAESSNFRSDTQKSDFIRSSELAGRIMDLITSPCGAATFFELRGWCAWAWFALAASSGWVWSDGARDSRVAWQSPLWTSHAACGDGCCRTISPDRFVDPDSGRDPGGPCVDACGLPSREPLGVRLHGDPRCRAGAAGPRSMVRRCPPIWMETHPDTRPIDLSTPL